MSEIMPPFDCSLPERIQFLFGQEMGSDVVFILKDDSRFPAHSAILSIGSPVFHAMFFGSMAEAKGKAIPVPDVEADAFRALMRYLYTDQLTPDVNTAMSLYYAGKKYQVSAVEEACLAFLDSNLDGDNALALLTHATLLDDTDLQEKILKVIEKRASTALSSEDLESLPLETFCTILECDGLEVEERMVYAAVCRWARAQCLKKADGKYEDSERFTEKVKKVASKPLSLVRYPLLGMQEFTATVAKDGLLDPETVLRVFHHFGGNPEPALPQKPRKSARLQRDYGSFRFAIHRFTDFAASKEKKGQEKRLYSPVEYFRGIAWKILAFKNLEPETLAVYLECCPETTSTSWKYSARVSLRVISQAKEAASLEKSYTHTFCSQADDAGFREMAKMDELLNPSRGLIKNDTIILEAQLKSVSLVHD